eukprot:Sspe_Gene.77700::Locus_48558_Transcript_1_1_Confidence_1.000_Length_1666::g.77700::m.77700
MSYTEQLASLKEAVDAAAAPAELRQKKEKCQELKEALASIPDNLGKMAGQVKAESQETETMIDATKKTIQLIQEETGNLTQQIEDLKGKSSASRIAEKQKELSTLREASEKAAADNTPAEQKKLGFDYLEFVTSRGDLTVKLQLMKATISQQIPLMQQKPMPTADEECKNHEQKLLEMSVWIDNLQKKADDLKAASWKHDVSLDQTRQLYAEAKQTVKEMRTVVDEAKEQEEKYKKELEEFLEEQDQLLAWVHAQKVKLEGLTIEENILDFCNSLQTRIPKMEGNFTVLQDMGENALAHQPNANIILSTLGNLNQAWIDLMILSFEKMQDTLMKQHVRSGLRDEVKEFAEWQREKVKPFLDEAYKLLLAPDEGDGKNMVGPVLERCRELQSDFNLHLIIMDHLADFEMRIEIVQENYKHLRRWLSSSMTKLCLRLSACQSGFAGKQEYDARLNELNDWIASRGSDLVAWEKAKESVSRFCMLAEVP